MFKSMAAVIVAATITISANAEELTIKRLTGSPALSGPTVQGLQVSPDGSRITFLRGKESNKSVLDLWEYDVTSKSVKLLVDSDDLLGGVAEELSEAEKAARERNRELTGKSGIVRYFWSDDASQILVPTGGDIYVMNVESKSVKRLTKTKEYETDIRFSHNGEYVSFVRNRDLYVVTVETGKEKRLTKTANTVISNGLAEFAAQEELNRFTGYWWSPDDTKIAYASVDESPVPKKLFTDIKADGSVATSIKRYPAAGTKNAIVDLGVVSIKSGKTKWIHDAKDGEEYLARVQWTPDSQTVSYQILERDQLSLDLHFYDVGTKIKRTVLSEKSDVWINLHKMQYMLKKSDNFIWAHERNGFRHLYLFDREGNQVKALTSGKWVVSGLAKVDEEKGLVYFAGFKDSVLEQHLYSVSLTEGPSSIKRVTREEGWHGPTVGKTVFVDKFSSPTQPPQVVIRSLIDGSAMAMIIENAVEDEHPFASYNDTAVTTTFGTIKSVDDFDLYYRMVTPRNMVKGKKYPTILAPYGGPHGHRVAKKWRVDINEYLARQGYVVMTLDNRGSWNRGLEFEGKLKDAMGTVEIEDQVTAAAYLGTLDFVDKDRIGFHGWSYGGYMTLMALFKHPEVFKVGVSVAPVTDWRLYDTAYTERYLSHPDLPGDVYKKTSVFPYVDNFNGKLLLIHGMADDNVFFDNSVKLMSVMQRKGMDFDFMAYPGKRHGIRGDGGREHVYMKMVDFFDQHLK